MKKWQKRYSKFAEENPGFLVLRNEDGFTKAWGRSAVILSRIMGTYISLGKHDGEETGVCDYARVERALKEWDISFLLIENGEIKVRFEGQDPFSMSSSRFFAPSVEATPVIMRDEPGVCLVLGCGRPKVRVAKVLSYQEAAIEQAVRDGYRVFVTCMYAGFELEAARAIIRLREKDKQLKLVLVKPLIAQKGNNGHSHVQFREITEQANWVEVLYTDSDVGWQQTVHWLVKRAKRILYATDDPERECVKYSQLQKENLREKEVFFLQPVPEPRRRGKSVKKPILYPENLLRALYGKEISGELERFPKDVRKRLDNVLAYCTKTQREYITQRYRFRMTYQEIGEKYHCTRQGVQNSVAAGIRKIKADYLFMDYIRGERDRP